MNFFFWNTIILYTYVYVEIFYSLIFFSIFRGLKYVISNISKKLHYFFFKGIFFSTYIYLLALYIITLKTSFINNNILSLLLIYLLFNKYVDQQMKLNFMFLNFNIFFFLIFILYINSLIVFFLFIELYSLLFYFVFLNIHKKSTSLNLLKLKNSLLLYLFSNFFTTILFLFGLNYIIVSYGTTNFNELANLNNLILDWRCFTIIIAFILKLALPGFHFIKLEIYKYLSLENVIYFSVMTLYINFILMIYLFNHNFIVQMLTQYKFIILLLLFTFFFFINKIQINNIVEFIAYSGFATSNLIVLNYIV